MKDWIVETRAVSRRVYLVQAEDEREAIYFSTHIPPESDEDEFEETMSVIENMAGVAEQSGAGAPETPVRCGAPAAQWKAFYNVSYPKLWGIETSDPAAVESGLEIVVAPCMPEHAAKDIARAWNEKTAAPTLALPRHNGDAGGQQS